VRTEPYFLPSCYSLMQKFLPYQGVIVLSGLIWLLLFQSPSVNTCTSYDTCSVSIIDAGYTMPSLITSEGKIHAAHEVIFRRHSLFVAPDYNRSFGFYFNDIQNFVIATGAELVYSFWYFFLYLLYPY
jgi:hypothetical protein